MNSPAVPQAPCEVSCRRFFNAASPSVGKGSRLTGLDCRPFRMSSASALFSAAGMTVDWVNHPTTFSRMKGVDRGAEIALPQAVLLGDAPAQGAVALVEVLLRGALAYSASIASCMLYFVSGTAGGAAFFCGVCGISLLSEAAAARAAGRASRAEPSALLCLALPRLLDDLRGADVLGRELLGVGEQVDLVVQPAAIEAHARRVGPSLLDGSADVDGGLLRGGGGRRE
jgi:hypothetical protein